MVVEIEKVSSGKYATFHRSALLLLSLLDFPVDNIKSDAVCWGFLLVPITQARCGVGRCLSFLDAFLRPLVNPRHVRLKKG